LQFAKTMFLQKVCRLLDAPVVSTKYLDKL